MVDNKKNKIKNEKYRTEEQQEIIRFVKILLLVIVFVLVFYFATRLFVKNDLGDNKEETKVAEIDYRKMVFGTMLNKTYDEYYVIAYSSKNTKANLYGAIIDKYAANKDSLNIYHIDLEDSLNKDFVATDGKSNPKAHNISELKVGDLTLIKVASGKMVKYIEGFGNIKTELGLN